jgi:hypothetical protein
MVLTVSSVLSLVTGLFCHHHQRDAERHHFSAMQSIVTGDAQGIVANLTPASGRQDHTASPYAVRHHSSHDATASIASRTQRP